MSAFASQSPGFYDDLLLVDSTPVECARSPETVKRSALGDAADYGYCARHSRFFWGFRLHAIFAPDGILRAVTVASPKRDERDIALELLARTRRQGTVTRIGDRGYAGKAFAKVVSDTNATILRPRRKDEPGRSQHLAPIRQRVESIVWSCKRAPSPLSATAPEPSKTSQSASCNAPRRRYLPEPPARPTQPRTRQLLRMIPVESII
jgi:hypothetical protein